jgi:hypothetical protein
MFLKLPKTTKKLFKKKKKDLKLQQAKKIYYYMCKRYEIDYKPHNPFNIKHLNFKGHSERFLPYFTLLNDEITNVNNWYNHRVRTYRKKNAPPQTFKIHQIPTKEKFETIDTFNIQLKAKQGASYNFLKSPSKQKHRNLKLSGSVTNFYYQTLLF